jgi:aryl-alcohol dehydrogenase-like predicted oxidoreductase
MEPVGIWPVDRQIRSRHGGSGGTQGGRLATRRRARRGAASNGDKRLDGANPFGDTLFTPRNWALVDVLKAVANEAGHSPAGIAYARVNGRPGVASTLLGVSRVEQLAENVAALDIVLTPAQRSALDAASAPARKNLYSLFTPAMRQHAVFGGSTVRAWGEPA